jgi:hypothetical protein
MGEQPVHFWGQVATSVPISTGVDSSTQATKPNILGVPDLDAMGEDY